MLEQISLSISTAIFLLCAMIANSVLPKSAPSDNIPPLPDFAPTAAVETTGQGEEFSIIGRWNSDGRIFEFTDTGKLIFGNTTAKYTLKDNMITVDTNVSGEKRQYTLPIIIISDTVISLNGVRMYRVES